MLFSERFPISDDLALVSGTFVYVIHFADTNYVMVGIGHESKNGLQLTHVPGVPIHSTAVHEIADAVEKEGLALKTGRIASHFHGEPDHLQFSNEQFRKTVANGMRKMHDHVWGHPMDWEPVFVDLHDGRFVWAAYGDDIDKIRIGIGFINESNDRVCGDACYSIGLSFVAEFTTEPFMRPIGMYFFSAPPRWPPHFPKVTDANETRRVMTAVLGLADLVWPGQVDEHVPRRLNADEITALNDSPAHERLSAPSADGEHDDEEEDEG